MLINYRTTLNILIFDPSCNFIINIILELYLFLITIKYVVESLILKI